MSKYTITIEGDFEKGECEKCPLSLMEYDLFHDDEWHCMTGGESSNCPLEEVVVAKNATVEGEWTHTGYGGEWECSNCKSQMALSDDTNGHPRYCPECGAKMKGGK
jgi:NAD-dependent SIR2 family protein deacetylase